MHPPFLLNNKFSPIQQRFWGILVKRNTENMLPSARDQFFSNLCDENQWLLGYIQNHG